MNAARMARSVSRGVLLSAATVTVATAGLLAVEAVTAAARRYAKPARGPGMRANFGPAGGTMLRLVMLGDSTAAGVGVAQVADSVGGRLAERLAAAGHRVELSSVAVSGSRSVDLAHQVSRALVAGQPDIAVILVGSQDAVHGARPLRAADALHESVLRLRESGASVIVGTCPDLSAARAIAQPLRGVVGYLGRRVARVQAPAVEDADGVVVDLAASTGAVFRADPGMLCPDGFHPSADGYRIWAHALYPAVAEAAQAVL